jgi:magnesium chelatase subunit D
MSQHARLDRMRIPYPFSAIVGQGEMKLALLLNAVSPQIAGVLVQGEKGTAKSTAVRALQALLPSINVVEHCAFGCDPADKAHLCQACAELLEREDVLPTQVRPVRLIELPLGATEDRVLGTLDLERAIKDGIRQFEPGLLAAAHRGMLYIDEVNLLPDHLVDALLDAATTGINVVEREGISFAHPARFLLIGTMNPEEGNLRPQLLDRFGLSVEVGGLKDSAERIEVVKRRIAFEADAQAFCTRWSMQEAALHSQIEAARRLLSQVVVSENIFGLIAYICAEVDVEGLRADLTIYKAATALAALEGRSQVIEQDVQRVAPMALAHRGRKQSFDQPAMTPQEIEKLMQEYRSSAQREQEASEVGSSNTHSHDPPVSDEEREQCASGEDATQANNSLTREQEHSEQYIPPSAPTVMPPLTLKRTKAIGVPKFKRSPLPIQQTARAGTAVVQARGRIVGAKQPTQKPSALALAPTLRSAALHQQRRRTAYAAQGEPRIWLERWDIREPVRQHKRGALILFAVDASGSMAAHKRMATAKGAVLALLQRAYQERDRVGLLQFRGTKAALVLPPTNSTSQASQALANLPTGGRTPLAAGLRLARRTLQTAMMHDSLQQPVLVLVTDGRANVADSGTSISPLEDAIVAAHEMRAIGASVLVIDTEEGTVRTGLARQFAEALGGSCVELTELATAPVAGVVRSVLGRNGNTVRKENVKGV